MWNVLVFSNTTEEPFTGEYANGRDYRGTLNLTQNGLVCQQWTVNTPHTVKGAYDTSQNGLGDHNYCRNPPGLFNARSKTVWCYTMDPGVNWEFCPLRINWDKRQRFRFCCHCLVRRVHIWSSGCRCGRNKSPLKYKSALQWLTRSKREAQCCV